MSINADFSNLRWTLDEKQDFNTLHTKFGRDNISLDDLIQGDHEAKYFTKFFILHFIHK